MNITRIATSLKRVANNKPVKVLAILLVLALVVLVVAVTHRPVIRWVDCESRKVSCVWNLTPTLREWTTILS